MQGPLLSARFSAGYPGRPGVLSNLELVIEPGEIVGLVGESGSGKSTLSLALMRLLEFRGGHADGDLTFRGRNLLELSQRQMRAVRGRGLMLAIELHTEAGGANRYCEMLKTRGLLAKETHIDTIRIAPPLVITRDQVDWALEQIAAVLTAGA